MDKKIIVFNVFLASFFSFVLQFCLAPISVYKLYTRTACLLITPYGGKGWPYSQLVSPAGYVGFKTPLKDLWVENMVSLIMKSNYRNATCHADLPWNISGEQDGINGIWEDSPRVQDQASVAIMEYLGPGFSEWKGDAALALTRPLLRTKLTYYGFVKRADRTATAKRLFGDDRVVHLKARHLKYGVSGPESTILHCQNIPNIPSYLRTLHVRLVCNAYPTDRRRRYEDSSVHPLSSPANPHPCYLCDVGTDSTEHFLSGSCATSLEALRQIRYHQHFPVPPDTLKPINIKATPWFFLEYPPYHSKDFNYLVFVLCLCSAILRTRDVIRTGILISDPPTHIATQILLRRSL